jgi:hypothetical protein
MEVVKTVIGQGEVHVKSAGDFPLLSNGLPAEMKCCPSKLRDQYLDKVRFNG